MKMHCNLQDLYSFLCKLVGHFMEDSKQYQLKLDTKGARGVQQHSLGRQHTSNGMPFRKIGRRVPELPPKKKQTSLNG